MPNYSNIFEKGYSYPSYRQKVKLLLQEGKTTGLDHSEAMLHYTKMNNHRMDRIEKTVELLPELILVISNLKKNIIF